MRVTTKSRSTRGQSMVETILMLPLLLLIVCNVVNLGYFFLIIVNLTGASRTSALYSIEGSYTPYAKTEAPSGTSTGGSGTGGILSTPGTVAYTVFQDLNGAVWNPTGSTIRVCTQMNINAGTGSGVNGAGAAQVANCETCDSAGGCGTAGVGSPAPSADPEAPSFVLNQVDITYSFSTLIPGTIFNIPLQASAMCNGGTCTFIRHAYMRSMGP